MIKLEKQLAQQLKSALSDSSWISNSNTIPGLSVNDDNCNIVTAALSAGLGLYAKLEKGGEGKSIMVS